MLGMETDLLASEGLKDQNGSEKMRRKSWNWNNWMNPNSWLLCHTCVNYCRVCSCHCHAFNLISIGRSRPSSRLSAKSQVSGHGEVLRGEADKMNHPLANQKPPLLWLDSVGTCFGPEVQNPSQGRSTESTVVVYMSIAILTCLHYSSLWWKSFLDTDFVGFSTRWCQRASEWRTGSENFGDIAVCAMSIH